MLRTIKYIINVSRNIINIISFFTLCEHKIIGISKRDYLTVVWHFDSIIRSHQLIMTVLAVAILIVLWTLMWILYLYTDCFDNFLGNKIEVEYHKNELIKKLDNGIFKNFILNLPATVIGCIILVILAVTYEVTGCCMDFSYNGIYFGIRCEYCNTNNNSIQLINFNLQSSDENLNLIFSTILAIQRYRHFLLLANIQFFDLILCQLGQSDICNNPDCPTKKLSELSETSALRFNEKDNKLIIPDTIKLLLSSDPDIRESAKIKYPNYKELVSNFQQEVDKIAIAEYVTESGTVKVHRTRPYILPILETMEDINIRKICLWKELSKDESIMETGILHERSERARPKPFVPPKTSPSLYPSLIRSKSFKLHEYITWPEGSSKKKDIDSEHLEKQPKIFTHKGSGHNSTSLVYRFFRGGK